MLFLVSIHAFRCRNSRTECCVNAMLLSANSKQQAHQKALEEFGPKTEDGYCIGVTIKEITISVDDSGHIYVDEA